MHAITTVWTRQEILATIAIIAAVFATVSTMGLLLAVGGVISVPAAFAAGAAVAAFFTGLAVKDLRYEINLARESGLL